MNDESSAREMMEAIRTILNDPDPQPMHELPPPDFYEVYTALDSMPFDRKSSVLGALRSILTREATASDSLSEPERKWLNGLNDADREWLNSLLAHFCR